MARVHVAEEARHMSYARSFVTEVWPTVGTAERWRTRLRAPLAVATIARALTNPAVYRTVGVRRGLAEARANPHHRERIVRDLGRLTGLLTDVGVITPMTRPLWRALGLIA